MSDDVIDLSKLPKPDVVEVLSFEGILGEMVDDYRERYPEFEGYIENDPVMKLLEVVAYRELMVRQRVNDAALAVMPAYAVGADLDNMVALFGVKRLVMDAGDADAQPPKEAVMEGDDALRRRYFLALNALNTAGSRNSYVYHAFSVSGVKDVGAVSMMPGVVTVTVLGLDVDGVIGARGDVLDGVRDVLNGEDVRPLTDRVEVQAARMVKYRVVAELVVMDGPDGEVVVGAAREALMRYVEGVGVIGREVALSGIYAALHRPGVERVVLTEPRVSVEVSAFEASVCEGIELRWRVVGDVG